MKISTKHPVIAWWSGGVTSAVACKLACEMYDQVRVIFIDTANEDGDTYRFMKDCEKWYGVEIETITELGDKYSDIQDVWRKHLSLNTANGAICSSTLKRKAREKWEKENEYSYQVFGFEADRKELNRAKSMKLNHSHAKPIFPLLLKCLDKSDCIDIVTKEGIKLPNAYMLGFNNNNCLNTGCIQGGIGYWQKIAREFPDRFNAMADIEHELTDKKGHQVTILKDQSKEGKSKGKYGQLVFLKKHPKYPNNKELADMKGREPLPLVECNGFCGTGDLDSNPTEKELNYEQDE